MLMTENEQKEMLNLINEAKEITQKKTNLMEELIQQMRLLLARNAELEIENQLLKRQLDIAESHIMREDEPQINSGVR